MTSHEDKALEVSSAIEQQNFDYTALDTETRVVVQQYTDEIKGLVRRTASDTKNIGLKLIEVKPRLGHGHFMHWLKSEFDWSISTANKFMQVGEQFKFINITNLDIPISVLYFLAAPSTPNAARNEAIERANSGESLTLFEAKAIIQRHKQANLSDKSKKTKPIATDADAQTLESKPFTAANPTPVSPIFSPLEVKDSIELAQASEENVAPDVSVESIETELKRRVQELGLLEEQSSISFSDNDDSEIGKSSSSTITSEVLCRAITSNVKLLSDEQVPSVLSTTIAATFPRLLPEQVVEAIVEAITNASTNQQLSSNNLKALIKAAEQALRFRQQLDE